MTEVGYVQSRHESLLREARDAFGTHVINQRLESVPEFGSSSWRLRKASGSSQYAAEVIAGAGAALIVHGDIDLLAWAYGPRAHVARVHWIGGRLVDDYMTTKAAVAMGGRELIESWDQDAAREHLSDLVASEREAGSSPEFVGALAEFEVTGETTREELINDLVSAGCEAEDVCHVGVVIAPRVYYAHAAVARLSKLLADEGLG